MAHFASDVLAVELLQKEVGVENPMRVVPLFELQSDLRNAGKILDWLFNIPIYRQRAKGKQEIMLGYSDSAKDAGRLVCCLSVCFRWLLAFCGDKFEST